MMATPGMFDPTQPWNMTAMQHSSLVDEKYVAIGLSVDQGLKDKIWKGEYVDFVRLLPRECNVADENRLELINWGGQTYFVPASDRDNSTYSISNFHKWEQAFRMYSNIYLQVHHQRATELIQYNHIIFTASLSYVWDNVYTYDREFRAHMAVYPDRSWAIILQQAWSMYLKDRINSSNFNQNRSGNFHSKGKKEACKHFNKGLCTAGRNCKYDHHCLECGKFGHGAHICRKRLQGQNAVSPQASTSQDNGEIPK